MFWLSSAFRAVRGPDRSVKRLWDRQTPPPQRAGRSGAEGRGLARRYGTETVQLCTRQETAARGLLLSTHKSHGTNVTLRVLILLHFHHLALFQLSDHFKTHIVQYVLNFVSKSLTETDTILLITIFGQFHSSSNIFNCQDLQPTL